MDIETALTAYVLSRPGITALIARRFFFDDLPMGTSLPAITCQNISDVKDHTHQGQLAHESPMYQFTVFASSRAGARAVANQIKTALCDFVGTMSGLTVPYVRLENELPNTERTSDGTVKVHTVDLEFEINFLRSD